jgi:hypothetical protein
MDSGRIATARRGGLSGARRRSWSPESVSIIVAEILASVEATTYDPSTRTWVGEYVILAERWRDPGRNTERMDL